MYTPQELIEINALYDELQTSCKGCDKQENRDRLRKAFDFALQAHSKHRRKSGIPYIFHPIEVALICTRDIGLGTTSAMAALMHDVIEDTDYTYEDIAARFGEKVASIIVGLTKIPKTFVKEERGKRDSREEISEQAENFRKLLLTISDDIRVILIKLADRLHNMRTLGSMPRTNQLKTSGETLYLYVPMAMRLGMYELKTELENLSLKHRFPAMYNEIEQKIEKSHKARQMFINKFALPITDRLGRFGINCKIEGRPKSIYSTWNKMQSKKVTFEEVYDLYAARIIFTPKNPEEPALEREECWKIFAHVTDIYKPKQDRTRDWINMPKENGYEALHVTVMGPEGKWVEVQIRSERMDEVARRGIAAHYRYKEGTTHKKEIAEKENTNALDIFIESIRKHLEQPEENALQFLDDIRLTFFSPEILVFTHRGYIKKMPKRSTVLDFAYEIHSEVGNGCIGAKVNYETVSLSHELKSGDKVEVITLKNNTPKEEWLNIAITTKAKQAIKAYLNIDRREKAVLGKKTFDHYIQTHDIPPNNDLLTKVFSQTKAANEQDLYYKIGTNEITESALKDLVNKAMGKSVKSFGIMIAKNIPGMRGFVDSDEENAASSNEPFDKKATVVVNKANLNKNVVIAKCCHPIPGDEIIGYRNSQERIVIHQTSCSMALKLSAQYGRYLVNATWVSEQIQAFPARVTMVGIDRMGLMHDITGLISSTLNVNMKTVHVETKEDVFSGYIDLYIHDVKSLQKLMSNLRKIQGIKKVRRENIDDDNE